VLPELLDFRSSCSSAMVADRGKSYEGLTSATANERAPRGKRGPKAPRGLNAQESLTRFSVSDTPVQIVVTAAGLVDAADSTRQCEVSGRTTCRLGS
jgi:hypothetical protein